MTNQRTDLHDLDVIPGAPVWHPGGQQAGLDDRVQYSHLSPETVAVRDPLHPAGPALMFSSSAWETFCGTPDVDQIDQVVDLRD